MELIGPHQVLGLLADLTLHGGQQLRRDGRIQNILQHIPQCLVLFRVVPGQIGHQVPHQSLGNGGIDGVHTHMVAVVGAPAQSQLAEVAGSDDDTAGLVGNIHQHLGALPGLGVFKGDGVIGHIVSDVLKVAADTGGDVHGAQRRAQLLCQDHGVVPGAVRGAEARHGHRHDLCHGTVQHLHGKARDQHRQSGVQSAGEAHHGRLGTGMLHPLLEAQRGNEQNLPAPGVPVLFSLGNKGLGSDIPGELGGDGRQGKAAVILLFLRVAEGLGPAALVAKLLHVDFREKQSVFKPLFPQQRSVFRNELVRAEHHVGGGLALSGAGIEIPAQQFCRLGRHQLAAIAVLAQDLITGREVADHRGPGPGHGNGRRFRRPQVLADLKAQHQLRQILTRKNLPGAEGYRLLPAEGNVVILRRCRSKLPLFVKLPIIGQMGLGYNAQNRSFLYNDRTVIQFVVHSHRHAHGGYDLQVPGRLQYRGQSLFGPPQQGILIKKIPAGIARQSQLRQHQHLGSSLLGRTHHGKGLLGIVITVRQTQRRRAAGHGNKTVLHEQNLLSHGLDFTRYCTPLFSP